MLLALLSFALALSLAGPIAHASSSRAEAGVEVEVGCVFTLNGTVYNLTRAQRASADSEWRTSQQLWQVTYSLHLCGEARSSRCAILGNGSSPAVCQAFAMQQSGDPYTNFVLGEAATQKVRTWEEGDLTGLLFEYSNGTRCGIAGAGEARATEVELVCDYSMSVDTEPFVEIDSVAEGALCVYTIRARSALACPSQCPHGFRGADCDTCLNGHYGPQCVACECVNGMCQDGVVGDGRCACESGWSGPRCDLCIDCTYQTSNGRFVYDLAPLAQETNDYSFVAESGTPFLYWLNIMAPVNDPCDGRGPHVAACQKVFDVPRGEIDYYSLGDVRTRSISALSVAQDNGVKVVFSNGTRCDFPPADRRFELQLSCSPFLNGTKLVSVTEASQQCYYLFEVESSQACPDCATDVPRYGESCARCNCAKEAVCESGIRGSGQCRCSGNFQGSACSDCKAGYYGSDCASACDCPSGKATCDEGVTGTGKCLCFAGFSGAECQNPQIDVSLMMGAGGVGIAIGFLVGAAMVALSCACYMAKSRGKTAYETLP